MIIGAHISTSKGLQGVVDKANEMGISSVQLFISPPRNWNPPKWSDEQLIEFKHILNKENIQPNFLHGIYLVNLHTDNSETRAKAINSVTTYMRVAKLMGARGVIIHSHRPNKEFISAINEILDNSPDSVKLIIEHSAVTTIEQTLTLFEKKNLSRMGLCLDACHLFAAGYDISKKEVVDSLLKIIDETIGLKYLEVIHINDAKSKLSSHRDVHQNLGEGSIGIEGIRTFVNHSKLRDLPFILETPGFDDKGPDKQNVDILKSLIN